jgi:hypothetical protein
MLAIVIVLGAAAFVAVTALAFAVARVDVDVSTWPKAFVVGQEMPPRPRGVQEEDLPRFVFRDRTSTRAGAV